MPAVRAGGRNGMSIKSLKESIWAERIISQQHSDGSWGYFHSLGLPSKDRPLTTEQALRRLQILGFTIDDEPIQKAADYMHRCLSGDIEIPDKKERLHDWRIFNQLMLSAWIRRFIPHDALAGKVAEKWAEVIDSTFRNGTYNHDSYVKAFSKVFGKPPRGGRFTDFVSFYVVSLLSNFLEDKTEKAMFDYILSHETGIYYVYESVLTEVPENFRSKQASRFIGAVELLSEYDNPKCKAKLSYVAEWLLSKREPDGSWDMGHEAKGGVYFPLSDSWRSCEARKRDCTYRIEKLLDRLGYETGKKKL